MANEVYITDSSSTITVVGDDSVSVGVTATIASTVAWGAVTGTLSDQSDLQTALDAKSASLLGFNSTATGYTLTGSDLGKVLAVSETCTITLPDGLDTGFNCVIENTGTSKTVTLSAATTLNTKDSAVTITSQYGAVSVVHKGSNVWHAWGDLA